MADDGAPELSFAFRDKQVPVTYAASVSPEDARMALLSEPFRDWVEKTSRVSGHKKIDVHSVEIQSVDMFGKRVGFVKIKSDCTLVDGKTHHKDRLPGICFLRGSSVGILVKLRCIDDGTDYSLLVEQPRIPIGEVCALELPAGMIDPGSGSVAGVAAKEMQEECELSVKESDLIDLTHMAYADNSFEGIYPSPGGSDEFIRLMYLEQSVTKQAIDKMRGRLAGLREEGEIITLRVVKFEDVWKVCADSKALCAQLLLSELQKSGKFPLAHSAFSAPGPEPRLKLNSGFSMPQLAFGLYKIEAESCESIALEAIEAGYRHFDSASIYGNEAELGRAMLKCGIPRDELFVCSKVWNDAQRKGRATVRESLEKSLAALNCDYLDLYLIHWPVPGHHVETYKELELLQQEGKIRSIGISNYHEEDYKELIDSGITIIPSVNQIEVSPAMYRADMINYFMDQGIVVSASKALHRGESLAKEPISSLAAKYSVTPAQIMIRWGMQKGLAVIVKTSNASRMWENRSTLCFALDEQDMALLDALTTDEDIAERRKLEVTRKTSL